MLSKRERLELALKTYFFHEKCQCKQKELSIILDALLHENDYEKKETDSK